ncbi:MAG: DUF1844 domain-containing protein [Terriglobia bacterium]
MNEEIREDSGFKVVDRRPFTVDGTRREEAPAREEKPEPLKSRAAIEAAPSPADNRVDEAFATLVEFLANSAFLHLGLVGGPAGEPIPVDLQSARTMIDLLSVLKGKTQGNLSAAEQKFLGDVLFELHAGFVEAQRQTTPKRK